MEEKKTFNFAPWLAGILLFLLAYPYFIWPFVKFFNWIVSLPLAIIFAFHIKKVNNVGVVFWAVVLLSLAAYCSGQSLAGTIFLLFDAVILLVDKAFLCRVYECFRKIFILSFSLSIFFYLLYLVGIPLPSLQIMPLNSLRPFNYMAYPFFVLDMADFGRFCGMFDEPGVVGVFSFIILFIEKFTFKRKTNLILLVAGLLSLSVFFYISFFVFYVFFRFAWGKERKKAFSLITGGVVVLVLLQSPIVNERIVERIQWNQEKNTLSGDDRASENLILYVESIRGTSQYYWGQRRDHIVDDYRKSASIYNAILIYGLVVTVLFFVYFFFFSIKHIGIRLGSLFYLLFLAMLLYNRPSMFPFLYFFLYVVALYSIEDYSKSASLLQSDIAEK